MGRSADRPHRRRRSGLAGLTGLLVGLVLGGALTWVATGDRGGSGADDGDQGRSPATTVPAAPTTTTPAGDGGVDLTPGEAVEVARAIGPLPPPSECSRPLAQANRLPNARREYRGGVHQGIDFICGELGHDATAPMGGRVIVAHDLRQEPTPEEREAVLDFGREHGDTPPWTLQLLYGRFVVVDHGMVPGAGHVVTVYAHLESIDPGIRPGVEVDVGARLGAIGLSGTEAAGTGQDSPASVQLHWEVHVDDVFLGRGLGPGDTRSAYEALFEE